MIIFIFLIKCSALGIHWQWKCHCSWDGAPGVFGEVAAPAWLCSLGAPGAGMSAGSTGHISCLESLPTQ